MNANTFLSLLGEERGAIVSSADCSEMEIAFARDQGRFYVDNDGMGYVMRPREWLGNAMAAMEDVADLHRQERDPNE